MMKRILIIFILFTSLFLSCSKKKEIVELKYTADEFDQLAHEATPSREKGDNPLKLSDYASGVNVKESKALVYNRLSFYAVSFETVEQARAEALRLNQYYARNWLFDRVEGEPVLEDYVIATFHAINPRRKIQRTPKLHAAPTIHH